jgi:DNA mismatch endonuclease, patch repair protein
MTDTLTKEERSARMSAIRGRDTGPELAVRRIVYGLGYRYRLHGAELPGRPDLVFRRRRRVIFVHGCFWHRHSDLACKLARLPKSRLEFWGPKLERNRLRDKINEEMLKSMGWGYLTIWECELRAPSSLQKRIRAFLDS